MYKTRKNNCHVNCMGMLLKICVFIFIGLPFLAGCKTGDPLTLTHEEKTWLKKHDGQITISNTKGWPPIIDTDINNYPVGIAVDYYKLIEKKFRFKFKLDKLDTWTNVVNKLQINELDVVCEMQKNPERSKSALFTKPYIEIPNVIIVRKEHEGSLALENMRDMRIAIAKGYAITDFIKENYSYLQLVNFDLETDCLLETVTKNVDAAVVNLAVASYFIEKNGITNLRVAGYTDYSNALCFASRKNLPVLNSILEKGLALITKSEKDAIYRNWISLGLKYIPFYKNIHFWIVSGSIFGAIIMIIITILFLNKSLKRQVRLRTEKLNSANIHLKNEINERKQAEEALRESEMRFQAAFDSAKDCILIWDKNYNYLYANQSAIDYVGTTPDKIISRNIRDVLGKTPESMTLWMSRIDKVFNTGKVLRVQDKQEITGRFYYTDSIISPIYASTGGVSSVCLVFRDVTELKKAEIALSQEKERLLVTLRSIGDGVITTDTEGRITLINKVAEKLTGWNQVEAYNRDIRDIFNIIDDKTGQKCENPVEKVLKAKSIIELANHTNLIAKDGSERMIADSGAPIFNKKNEIVGVVLVFRDVTEKNKIDKQLQQAQKMEAIGTLAGGIAHDFNNMLGVITGNISYALSNLKNDDLSEVLFDIQESAKQAQSLTHQLLTFAKGGSPVKKVTDINRLIKESAIFSTRGSKTNCIFILSDNLWAAEIDEGQINQVIGNFIINADQAMPNGGTVTVRTKNMEIVNEKSFPLPAGRYIQITVEDQGIGISKKHLPNIFEPYYTTKQKGSGLGLTTAYSIIKKHDGHINVSSEIDKGSIFNIYLPASLMEISKFKDNGKHEHSGKGRILVMDDQEPILKMLEKMLDKMGYKTTFAKDGTRAVEAYSESFQSGNPFDLVILDLTVPCGMGGAETIAQLLKIDPKVKAVVSSGYSNDPIMANYSEYGFCGVIPKPYMKNHLAELLNRIFGETG